MKKLVTIVLINYNNNHLTIECLNSFKNQTYKNFEIILVDNASESKSFLPLKQELSGFENDLNIKLIRSNYNLFVAGGNNKAFKHSSGEYICILNNDTEVQPNFIEAMVNFLEKTPDAGMISPKIKIHTHRKYLWYSGTNINFMYPFLTRQRGYWEKDSENQIYKNISPTGCALGTAMFLKKHILEEIGFWDDLFFIYHADVDQNVRAQKRGYKSYYVPTTIVYHKVFEQRLKSPPLATYYFQNRNLQIVIWKHAKLISVFIFYIGYFTWNLIELIIHILKRRKDYFFLRIHSIWHGFRAGFKRRTNRSCKTNLIKDYNFIKRVKTRFNYI